MRAQHIILLILFSFTAIAAHSSWASDTSDQISPSNYLLHPGDIIRITVWREEGMDQELTILPDGTVNYPLIGTLQVADKRPAEVQALVTDKLSRIIPAASVTVSVKEARGNSVSVLGQVGRPGEIVMTRKLTVMQALSQAGGITNFADSNDITILRKTDGKESAITFNYDAVAAGRSLESNIELMPGDVIVVPAASLF